LDKYMYETLEGVEYPNILFSIIPEFD